MPRHEYCTVTMAHARNDRFIVTRVDFTPLGDGSLECRRNKIDLIVEEERGIFLRSLRVSSINFELTLFFKFNIGGS